VFLFLVVKSAEAVARLNTEGAAGARQLRRPEVLSAIGWLSLGKERQTKRRSFFGCAFPVP